MGKESQDLRGVTLKRAGEIIGGDKPLSVRVITRYIQDGKLKAYGERAGRRVTMRSIDAYIEGEPIHDTMDAAPVLPSRHIARRRRGGGSRDTTSSEDSIAARLPRLGVIKSRIPRSPKGGWQ
jgi:hypothetical protein